MSSKNGFFDLENRIGEALSEDPGIPAPDFAGVAGRIAAGEPTESFEAFFDGDIPLPGAGTAGNKRPSTLRLAGGAIAAALVLFAGGGIALAALSGAGNMGTKQASADAAVNEDCEYYDSYSEIGNDDAKNCADSVNESVSESDMKDPDNGESAGSVE